MTAFRPCNGCTQRKDCDIKKGVAKALRGQPITSARIKCDLPFTKYFPPGTRVSVIVWDAMEFDAHRGETPKKLAKATVVGPSTKKPGRLLTWLDEPVHISEDSTIEFRAAYPKDVNLIDEPRREWCSSCNRALVHDKCSCPDFYTD